MIATHFWSKPHRATLSLFMLGALFATWQIPVSPVHAQEIYAEIAKYQERFQKLENELATSQRRMLSSANPEEVQVVAKYTHLEHTAQLLASANREFGVLSQSLTLAALVTDAKSAPLARRVVELQKEYMLKRLSMSADFIEKNKHRTQDPETSRLLLEARDLLRSSMLVVNRIPWVAPKQ
jgi:hypothetical protein